VTPLLSRISEALRRAEPDTTHSLDVEPVEIPAAAIDTAADVEQLPPNQRRVRVPFEQVLADSGRGYPSMRRRLVPSRNDVERARRGAEAAIGRVGEDVLWPD
jgi:hypothetical protein